MHRLIYEFKCSCSEEQLRIINHLWPYEKSSTFRVGVMKLVPKVHKLEGLISHESWKKLSSRPIRGAEMDPMRFPSKVLFRLLNNMLQGFQKWYETMSVLLPFKFPVITGCDEFSSRVKELRLDRSKMMQTTFLSADFGDAYTETGISSLQASIRLIGEQIGVDYHEIDLMVKLVNLVFSNCYFFTPFGLYKQTRGMPMGDYSSRDSLDLHLVKSEYEILLELSKLSSSIHLYCRLVDDISVIIQGDFSTVRLVLQKMSYFILKCH